MSKHRAPSRKSIRAWRRLDTEIRAGRRCLLVGVLMEGVFVPAGPGGSVLGCNEDNDKSPFVALDGKGTRHIRGIQPHDVDCGGAR